MTGGGGAESGSNRGAHASGYDKTGPELGYSGPSTATGAMEAGVDPGLAHAAFGKGRQNFGDLALDAIDKSVHYGLSNVFDRETATRNLITAGIKAGAGLYGGPLGLAASVAINALLDDTPKTDPLKNSGVSFDPNNTGIVTNPNLGIDPDRVGLALESTNTSVDPSGQYGSNSQQSLTDQSIVNKVLNEANARNKTAARERAKALAKETARLKAKEEHRIQVLKDRADKKAAEEQWNPNIVPEEEVIPIQLPPLVIDDGPTTHEANVAKREATKARLATARGKTKSHLANLRKKGVSTKTIAKAKSKAKARYAKIKSK